MYSIDNLDLNYPKAREWMWDYCLYLGPWTDPHSGRKYDLGVYVTSPTDMSAAAVFGNTPGDYLSGQLDDLYDHPAHTEIIRRCKTLEIWKN